MYFSKYLKTTIVASMVTIAAAGAASANSPYAVSISWLKSVGVGYAGIGMWAEHCINDPNCTLVPVNGGEQGGTSDGGAAGIKVKVKYYRDGTVKKYKIKE